MEKEIEKETEKKTEEGRPAEGGAGKTFAAADERRPSQQRDRAEGQDSRPRRHGGGRGRRRYCVMCADKITHVDYKDFGFLRRFISDRGRIESRRKSGTCAKHQRAVAQAVKRARHLALLPYTAEHVRGMGVTQSR